MCQASNAALQRQVMGGAGLAPLSSNGGLAPLSASGSAPPLEHTSSGHGLLERRSGHGPRTAGATGASAGAGGRSLFPGLQPASARASKLGVAAAGALPVSRGEVRRGVSHKVK